MLLLLLLLQNHTDASKLASVNGCEEIVRSLLLWLQCPGYMRVLRDVDDQCNTEFSKCVPYFSQMKGTRKTLQAP